MLTKIDKVLISEDQLRDRIAELGEVLTRDYEGKNPVVVGVLKGVVVFYADMVREITVPCQFDFMWISSYSGTETTGQMVVKRDISADIKGRHVVILEDIFDTGNSLQYTYHHLLSKEPLRFYQENPVSIQDDYHTAYYGEIVSAYIIR